MERLPFTIIITGEAADETAALLRARLFDVDADASCRLHVESDSRTGCADADFVYTLAAHDTPAFAVEKILDQLAGRGWIVMDTGDLRPEEEEQIRARLQRLGYVD